MMLRLSEARCILAYSEPVDMRKSFDGLIAVTQHVLKQDPLSGSLFLFSNRRGNLVKILWWDRTGYCLYAKRLERGRFRFRPGELSVRELELMLDGISLRTRQKTKSAVHCFA